MDHDQWQDKTKQTKSKNKPKVTESYDDDFQSENTTSKKPIKQIDLPKIDKNTPKPNGQSNNKPKQAIQEESQEDAYGDDFQQPSNKKLPDNHSKVINKIGNTSQKLSPQINNKGTKPYENSDEDQIKQKKLRKTSSKKQKNDVKTHPKTDNPVVQNKIKKSESSTHVKQSPHPHQSLTKKSSQSVMKNNSIQIDSKYMNYMKTQFPHTKDQVLQFPPQKINRLNQKLRGCIKKVNDELTDLINENMRLLKVGTIQSKTQGKTVDDVIKMLMEQKKNGQTHIESVQKHSSNLTEQWEKISNEDFDRITDEQIRQISQKIKEYTKEIYTLKYDMKMEGNKLAGENNYAQKIVQLKSKLLIMKRQEQKYAQKLQKCDKNAQQLSSKNPKIDIQLQKLLQQAKKQHIVLNLNTSDKKRQQKYEQLKKKAQNIRLHQQKTQSLCETKTSILKKDIDNISSQVAQIEKKFTDLEATLHSTQQTSIQLIEEYKQKDLQPYIQTHLDFIYKNIKEGNPLTTISLLKPSNSRQKGGLKKYASSANAKGFVRSQSEAELKPSFHITKKAPLQIKTKQKVALKLGQKTQPTPVQRVWKGDTKENKQIQKIKEIDDINSSKPFVIRRSQNVSPPLDQNSKKTSQVSLKQEQQKENQKSTSVLGPKKMFKKGQTTQFKSQKSKQTIIITQKNANEPEQAQNDEEDHSKPQFKIKKARKSIVEIPDEDLYLFPPGTVKNIKGLDAPKQQPKNSPKNTIVTDTLKQTGVLNVKGPNFKISGSKNNQGGIEAKLSLEQNQQKTFLTNIQVSENKAVEVQKEPPAEQNGVNIGGRRQVQRKIQRKNQDSYVA